jgi:hypothetical protein
VLEAFRSEERALVEGRQADPLVGVLDGGAVDEVRTLYRHGREDRHELEAIRRLTVDPARQGDLV